LDLVAGVRNLGFRQNRWLLGSTRSPRMSGFIFRRWRLTPINGPPVPAKYRKTSISPSANRRRRLVWAVNV